MPFTAIAVPAFRLEAEGIGFFRAFALDRRQRCHGTGLVEPDPGVELAGQDRRRIMAPAFGVRAVDHADEALQPRLRQRLARGLMLALAKVEQEARDPAVMALPLIAVGSRRIDALDLHR